MKALLSIDYTNDFVATKGALTTGAKGQSIEQELVALTQAFISAGEFVVFAIDAHQASDQYHPENALFPPHNLMGSAGRRLYGGLEGVYQTNKEKETVYWLDKRHYSAFSGTDLDIRLRERGIREIHLSGVCTDICVLHTAIAAYNLGYKLVVHQGAVQSFDEQGHKWALAHFQNTLGAKVI